MAPVAVLAADAIGKSSSSSVRPAARSDEEQSVDGATVITMGGRHVDMGASVENGQAENAAVASLMLDVCMCVSRVAPAEVRIRIYFDSVLYETC